MLLAWKGGVKRNETTYLGKFKWGRKQQTIIPENPQVQIMDLVLLFLLHIFRVVKQENIVDLVKLGIFPPHLHIRNI